MNDIGLPDIVPGHYIVAVSGGVDSVALLDMLVQKSRALDDEPGAEPGRLRLTVAHYDHGIRPDSASDRLFVQRLASAYGVPFVFDLGNLGAKCSEAKARDSRYAFLYKVQGVTGADAVITAHHADDVLETAVINMMRGTGPRGLAALKSGERIVRPLLDVTKIDIVSYAKKHHLTWREDSTNSDDSYLRNYVRHKIIPQLDEESRGYLLSHISTVSALTPLIDDMIFRLVDQQASTEGIDRSWFVSLPHDVSKAVMHAWLRRAGATHDRQSIQRLVVAAKTLPAGKIVDIDNRYKMTIRKDYLALKSTER